MFNIAEFDGILALFQGVLADISPGRYNRAEDNTEGRGGIWARFWLADGTIEQRGDTPACWDAVQQAVVSLYVSHDYKAHRRDENDYNAERLRSHWAGLLLGRAVPLTQVGDWLFSGGFVADRDYTADTSSPYLLCEVVTLWRRAL